MISLDEYIIAAAAALPAGISNLNPPVLDVIDVHVVCASGPDEPQMAVIACVDALL